MQTLLQTIVLGITSGAVDALLALAIVLIYRTTGVLNFAQAATGSLAAYVAFSLAQGRPLWLALGGMLLVAGALGAATSLAVSVAPGPGHALTSAVASLAVGILLEQIIAVGWGSALGNFPAPFGPAAVTVGGISVTWSGLAGVVVAAGLALALAAFLRWTRRGTMLRALEDDPEAVTLCGADVGHLVLTVWAIAGALAAIAAFFAAQLLFAPGYLDPYFLAALVAAVVGGLRSLTAAFAGALALEVARDLFQTYAPNQLTPFAQTFLILVLIAVLVLAPRRWLTSGGERAT